jgi:PIN domain nuclease of toxin-antitoxin system
VLSSVAVLIDTHVWIWAAADTPRRLGPKTRRLLARGTAASLCVSAASAFEITALHTAGRLKFNQPAERWIRESIERGRLRVLDVSTGIATDAGAIPADSLADPIDRLLVATARERDVPLLTRDQAILEYATRTRLVRVVDAST